MRLRIVDSSSDTMRGVKPLLISRRIFTWRGGKAARVYMDGHAIMGDSRSIGWIPNGQRDGVWRNYGSNFRVPEPWYEMR